MAKPPLASLIWKDGPASMPTQPVKHEIRQWGTYLEGIVDAFTSNGGLIYDTLAMLHADTGFTEKRSAWVINDPVVGNNGVYGFNPASHTWSRKADLPFPIIVGNDAGVGTPNAIQITTAVPASPSSMIRFEAAKTNTTEGVTLSINGGDPMPIKTNSGGNVSAGGILAGMILFGAITGSDFRLQNDQSSAAIIAAAEAARDAAEEAAALAEGVLVNAVQKQTAAPLTGVLGSDGTAPADGTNYTMDNATTPELWFHSPHGYVPGDTLAIGTNLIYKFERGWEVQEGGFAVWAEALASPRVPGGSSGNIFTDGTFALFGGHVARAGSGSAWSAAFNSQVDPGWQGLGAFATEMDMNNYAYDAYPGNPYGNIANVFINGIYAYPATAGTWQTGTSAADLWTPNTPVNVGVTREANGNIYRCIVAGTTGSISAPAGTTNSIPDGTAAWEYVKDASANYCSEFGDFRQGARLVRAATYFDDTEARSVLVANSGRTHSVAVIDDRSAGPVSYLHQGFRTQAVFRDIGTAPVSIDIQGTHSAYDARFNGGAGIAVRIEGTRSGAGVDTTAATLTHALKLGNGQFISFVGDDINLLGDASNGRLIYRQSGAHQFYFSPYGILPATDNAKSLGFPATNRWKDLYLANNPTVTSSRELKANERAIDEAVLEAALAFEWKTFQYRAAIAEKGEDVARWHIGVIAEDVVEAFQSRGIDPFAYGFVGYDDVTEEVIRTRTVTRQKVETITEMRDEIAIEDGIPVMRSVEHTETVAAFAHVQVINADGSPMMQRVMRNGRSQVILDDDGSPVMKKVVDKQTGETRFVPVTEVVMDVTDEPVLHPVPVMEDVEESYAETVSVLDEDGQPKKLLCIRYEQLLAVRLAAIESRVLA